MRTFAESLGFAVSFEKIDGPAGGWCDPKKKRIVVDADAPANARLRTLIHECAHAMGIDYRSYSRPQAEERSKWGIVERLAPQARWRILTTDPVSDAHSRQGVARTVQVAPPSVERLTVLSASAA